MKLKVRADAKDLIIFGIFSLILLYLCAIAVLNLSEFALYGTVYGLNPFKAFTSKYIGPTFLLFFSVLISLIMGVSSKFFDLEKGIGISTNAKNEKGYSRWLTDKEMKKQLKEVDPLAPTSNAAGVPLIMTEKKVWVDDGGYHNLVIGSTGAGKTQTTVLPMVNLLAKNGESMIITDPKGEIYESTSNYLKSLGYNIVLLNFRDPQQGNAWNPMYLPYSLYKSDNEDKAVELLEDLAANILKDPSAKGQDPFWENTSADYFAGLSCALFEDADEKEINLNSINLMTTIGEEKIGNSTYVKEYFSYKNPSETAYTKASSTLMAPNETRGSILSVFKQRVQLFASRSNLSEMLANNDFDMRDIGRKKTAVFIVIQDEKTTYHTLVTIFLKQCYETLISVAQESGGQLPHRTNFILDEFANMPPLKDVTTMVTAARSRNIRFTFIIQNFAQLYEVYGKENGDTIKGNCGNIIYLISTELSALEEISKMCGEVKSKDKDKTASTPLVTVSDLQRLKQWETIVLRLRMMPYKTKLTPNYKMNWGHDFPKAGYPKREKQPVQIFDIREFVDKRKEEKVNSMLNNLTGGGKPTPGGFNPFSNPFGMDKPNHGGGGGMLPGGFDVDEMVRRIDAKIAELEEEERLEKEKAEKEKAEKENKAKENKAKEKETDSLIDMMVPVQPEPFVAPVVEMPKMPTIEEVKNEVVSEPIEEQIKETVIEDLFASDPIMEKINIPKKEEQIKSNITQNNNHISGMTVKKPEHSHIPVTPKYNPYIQKNTEYIDNKKNDNNYISDDQFFDDFFGEDD